MNATDPTFAAQTPDPAEAALWSHYRSEGSVRAREALFVIYQPFARSIARRHFRNTTTGIEFPDLCQLAYAGLLEALDRFDTGFNVPFRGYAARRISGSVLDGISKMSEVREQISFRNRIRAERAQSLAPDNPAVLSSEDAFSALAAAAVGLALGFMLEEPGIYVPDDTRDRRPDAYESVVWKDAVRRVMSEVGRLPDREQLIIRQHYLNGLGFEQIGGLLNVTKGRVSQMHKAALLLLKARL